jgi:multiple sugar transport system permease protein
MNVRDAAARPGSRPIRRGRFEFGDNTVAYLLLLPSVLMFAAFIIFPVVSTFVAAFSELDTLGRIVRFGTLKNIEALARDQFLPMIVRQTVVFALGSVGLTTVLAFALALILNSQFRGREIAKALLLIPWATPFAVAAMTWRWIFHGQVGALNYFLGVLGIIREPVGWLDDPLLAFGAALFVEVWSSIPFMTITFLAGMQAIPGHIYDAAKMDGAGVWQEFRDMTLPQMRTIIMIVTLLSIIWAFRSFGIIWVLTRGNPLYRTDLVVTYLYKLAFENNNFGAGFALAVAIFVVLAVFSVIYVRILSGQEEAR